MHVTVKFSGGMLEGYVEFDAADDHNSLDDNQTAASMACRVAISSGVGAKFLATTAESRERPIGQGWAHKYEITSLRQGDDSADIECKFIESIRG